MNFLPRKTRRARRGEASMKKMMAVIFAGIFALAFAAEDAAPPRVQTQADQLRAEMEVLKRQTLEIQRARDEVAKMQKGGFINDKDAQARIADIENVLKQTQARQAELDARAKLDPDKAVA